MGLENDFNKKLLLFFVLLGKKATFVQSLLLHAY